MVRPSYAVFTLILLALTCDSSDDDSGDGSGGSNANGCIDISAAFCGTLEACVPVLLRIGFGDTATCASRFGLSCEASLEAPGTSMTSAKLSGCARALDESGCDAVFGDSPSACEPDPGSLPDGSACA